VKPAAARTFSSRADEDAFTAGEDGAVGALKFG